MTHSRPETRVKSPRVRRPDEQRPRVRVAWIRVSTASDPASQKPNGLRYRNTISAMNITKPDWTLTSKPRQSEHPARLGGSRSTSAFKSRALTGALCCPAGMSYVFSFDHKHRRPPMEYKDLLGGKGAQSCGDDLGSSASCPPRLHDLDRCLSRLYGHWLARRTR